MYTAYLSKGTPCNLNFKNRTYQPSICKYLHLSLNCSCTETAVSGLPNCLYKKQTKQIQKKKKKKKPKANILINTWSQNYQAIDLWRLSIQVSQTTVCWQTRAHTSTWDHSPLDALLIQVFLLAWHIVGPHDAHLLACSHSAREHTTEGKETSLVTGWHHLGDVHHQLSLGVAGLDAWTGM